MPTYKWPNDEDRILSKLSKDGDCSVHLDKLMTIYVQNYLDLQPLPGEGTTGEAVDDGWIPLNLAWLATGVSVVAIGSLTAILFVAMNKGYDVSINFGELAGQAVLNLTRGLEGSE